MAEGGSGDFSLKYVNSVTDSDTQHGLIISVPELSEILDMKYDSVTRGSNACAALWIYKGKWNGLSLL